jgi:C-terminal processing protease CtpA/Prc
VQEWLTPDKRSFWHRGIEPDVKVAMPVQGAALRPLAERELTAEQLRTSGDAQLLKAIAVLSDAVAKPGPMTAGQ